MPFVVFCPGTPEGLTGSGSGFKASQKTGIIVPVTRCIQYLECNIKIIIPRDAMSADWDCGIS